MIRILFVDDEANVLQAMRRTLHCMREEWNMEFVAGGAAALQSLAQLSADVIVCDMRMPGMDGWQVLAEVKARHPHTTRFILSGYGEPGAIMRSVGVAHQYLAKPCDGATLKAAIVQSQNLRQLLTSDRLAPLVGGIGMLPTAPHVFQELQACLQRTTSSITDVARIISRDVAMTANTLKLVNSAFFGSRRPITTPERAVAYLGLDTLGALVLGHSVFKTVPLDASTGFSHEGLWEDSLRTATAARAIAQHENCSAATMEQAFLAGVLHDVGKVVLAAPGAAPVGGQVVSRELRLAHIERHHAEVGAYLLSLWGFPVPIVEAVAFHDDPSRASGNQFGLAGIIHVAERLTHHLQVVGCADVSGIQAGFLEQLGMSDRPARWSAALNSLESAGACA